MTLMICADHTDAIRRRTVGNAPWQKRAKAAGLSQKVLARLLGRAENTVSRQLAGKWEGGVIPQNAWAAIIAWEVMTDEQRKAWIVSVDQEIEIARREKKPKPD